MFTRRLIFAATLSFPLTLQAQSFPTTQPIAPLLEQIDTQTRDLFRSIRPGLVSVELPPAHWVQALSDADNPVQKWNSRLDAQMREKLRELQMRAAVGGNTVIQTSVATSQPTSSVAGSDESAAVARLPKMIVFPPADGIASLSPADIGVTVTSPRLTGIVLDDAGHVLVPVYIEKAAAENRTLTVIDSAGVPWPGRFIGSDENTGLTVLQCTANEKTAAAPAIKPLKFAGSRPVDGSLVLMLAPGGENGRLSIWTNGLAERGLVIGVDGTIRGFARVGQFLDADSIRPLAEQLTRYGRVRRAVLGVWLAQGVMSDGQPALRIEQVQDRSPAAAVGLKPGDYIRCFGSTPMTDIPSFSAAIAETDGRVDLSILRNNTPMTVTVELHP